MVTTTMHPACQLDGLAGVGGSQFPTSMRFIHATSPYRQNKSPFAYALGDWFPEDLLLISKASPNVWLAIIIVIVVISEAMFVFHKLAYYSTITDHIKRNSLSLREFFVGARGFEPRTSRTRTVRSSRAEPRPADNPHKGDSKGHYTCGICF